MSKKILIVSDFYEPHKSGIVTYINQLIKSLKEKGYIISVLTTKHTNELDRIDFINDIKIIRCKPTIAISRGFYSLDLVITFYKIYKNFDYINLSHESINKAIEYVDDNPDFYFHRYRTGTLSNPSGSDFPRRRKSTTLNILPARRLLTFTARYPKPQFSWLLAT